MTRISGKVIEKWSNKPVGNAIVTINVETVQTDAAGNFSIDTPNQTANIQVFHIGYEPIFEKISVIGENNQIEIILTPIVWAL